VEVLSCYSVSTIIDDDFVNELIPIGTRKTLGMNYIGAIIVGVLFIS